MVHFISGGGAAQTSTGFGFTLDKQSVRHQQSLGEQTDHVRTGAYAPRRKIAAETTEQWRARLVRHAPETRAAIAGLDAALARFEQAGAAVAPRPLAHRAGRALNWVAAIPDAGNVKANREQAVRLSARAPQPANRLRKPVPAALRRPDSGISGYASLEQHKQALTATQQHRYIGRLRREADEMLAALDQQWLQAGAARDGAPAAYHLAQREIQRNGGDSEGPLAAAEERLLQARQPGAGAQPLVEATARHAAAAAAHAHAVLPEMRARLQATLARLGAADTASGDAAGAAQAALRDSQNAAIDAAIAGLPGFTIAAGHAPAAAAALRARLRQAADALMARPFDAEAQAMPAPLLMDLLIGAMAETADGDVARVGLADAGAPAAPPAALLTPAAARRVLDAVRCLPGGMLAAEQMSGAVVKDKDLRAALRVGALAARALARLPAAAADGDAGAPLRAAAEAARKIADGAGHDACGAAELAAYNAVRNGFLLEDAGGPDHKLLEVEQRLDKLLGAWVERAAEPRRQSGPMLNKTPFDATSLRLANQTSILGYDAAERPMARLDATLRRVQTQLGRCADHIAPGTLSVDEAAQLAAQLVAAEKADADRGLRPGQVALTPDDTARLATLLQGRLRPLIAGTPSAAALREAAARSGAVADPLVLAPFVAGIAGRIGAPTPAALRAREQLLKDAGIARDMSATAQVERIRSSDDLFHFLEPMVQQLELRGKIKITSGGNVGGSSKLFTWPIAIAKKLGAELVIPVRGELKGNRARGAVFEIGFSTTGFEIFIGSETRKGRGVGGGVGFRLGWERVASSGGNIDKTLSQDQAETEGVWLRLPRNSDDERTRDEALAMLRTLFGMDGDADGGDPGDGGADAVPRRVGRLLARHPNLSLSVADRYREDTVRNEVAVNAALLNVKAGSGDDAARFALLSAGVKTERRDKGFELRDGTGFMQISRSNALSGGIAFAQAGLVSIGAGFDTGGAAKAAPGFGNGFTYARQLAEKGIDTKLRFITRDGDTNPVDSRVDYENLDFTNHRARIAQDRRAWLETGVRELFKPVPGRPAPPLNEQMRVAEHWLDTMLQQAGEQSAGNARHVYSLSYSMMKTAAAAIDGLRAKAALARRAGDERAAGAIDREVDQLLQHPASWQPWKITTSERTSEREQMGANLGLVYGAATTAEGQRGTNSYPK